MTLWTSSCICGGFTSEPCTNKSRAIKEVDNHAWNEGGDTALHDSTEPVVWVG